jgi:hypothetical protein
VSSLSRAETALPANWLGRLRWLSPGLVVAVLLLAYLGLTLARHGGDPLAFVRLGEGFAGGEPVGEPGYDGQFAYWIAVDPRPAVAGPHLDVPAYRYQRVLYPLLAWALAAGHPGLVPWTLVIINFVAQVALTVLVERWLAAHGRSRWFALTVGLWAGLVLSVRLDLSEPLCFALVMAGLLAVRGERFGMAAVLMALAVVTKETALLFVIPLLAWAALNQKWRALTLFGLALVPFAVLQGLLLRWFGALGLATGGYLATPLEIIPYNGLWRIAAVSVPAFVLLLVIFGPMVVVPSVWGIITTLRRVWARDYTPIVLVLGANAAFIAVTPHATFREPLGLIRLATGLVLATVLYGAQAGSRRVLNYSLLWLAALALAVQE